MTILLFLLSIYPEYHTFNELKTFIDSMVSLNSNIIKVETLEYTDVEHNPIYLIKISDNPEIDEDEPSILIVGVHHAEEVLGLEISIFLIRDLIKNYNIDSLKTKFVNENEIYIIPCLNPDGHNVVTEGLCEVWRKNKRDNNNNGIFDYKCGVEGRGDGVDLNRNYDYLFDNAGSSEDTSEYYRGPFPFSEPETRAVKNISDRENFVFAVSYHSARTGFTEVIYYPWREGINLCPDFVFISEVADSFANKIPRDDSLGPYITMVTSKNLGGFFRNWIYSKYGTFSFTVEVSDTTIPPPYKIKNICEKNVNAIYYLLKRMHKNTVKIKVMDEITGKPLKSEINLFGIDTTSDVNHFTTSTNGEIYRILKPANYTVLINKEGYKPETLNFTLNENEFLELNVPLYPFVRDTYPQDFYVYQNVTEEKIRIIYWVKNKNNLISVRIYDFSGRNKFNKYFYRVPGFYKEDIKINLPSGSYIGEFRKGDFKILKKIIILK